MDKELTVYPIPAGNELHVFCSGNIRFIKIMDMSGNVIIDRVASKGNKQVVDIRQLPSATYIVEAAFDDNRKGRSIFVKM
jgi:hypothetical protein